MEMEQALPVKHAGRAEPILIRSRLSSGLSENPAAHPDEAANGLAGFLWFILLLRCRRQACRAQSAELAEEAIIEMPIRMKR
jgi:hypothetical protein